MAFRIRERWSRQAEETADRLVCESIFRCWKYNTQVSLAIDCTMTELLAAVKASKGNIGDEHAEFSSILCDSITPSEVEPNIYDVAYHWQTPSEEALQPEDFDEFLRQSNQEPQPNQPDTNPFGPKFSGTSNVIDWYQEKDLDGKPFLNSAGDPFTNVPAIPITIQIDRVTFNAGSKPDTSRVGLCEGRKMLAGVNYEAETHINRTTGVRTTYYVNTFERWTHPFAPWHLIDIMDRGYNQKFGDRKEPIMLGESKEPPHQPQCLDGAGKLLNIGVDAKFLTFRIRPVGSLSIPHMS